MILDPRKGDAEDDASAPIARSMASIAGGMIAEISPIKVFAAFGLLILAPNLMLGFAPLVGSAWVASVSAEVLAITSLTSVALLALLAAAAYLLWRPLFQMLESNFWSLNSVLVQPGYVVTRETLRHLFDGFGRGDSKRLAALCAGVMICGASLLIVVWAWPHTRWIGAPVDLIRPRRLVAPALANAVTLIAAYAAAAALAWGFADGTMQPVRDIEGFDAPKRDARRWRVAHLSDIHVVGERYGFRIESGRTGPQGNARFAAALERLAAIHAADPLDVVLFSGDMTDAGRSAEWAEFLDALEAHPALAAIALTLPGNHDINIVDRANPARLDLPWTLSKSLRRVRMLAIMQRLQASRTLIKERDGRQGWTSFGARLAMDEPALRGLGDPANAGGQEAWRRRRAIDRAWRDAFPQILPPATPDGLGVILLDSNAETHFSFTNALGLLSASQALRLDLAFRRHPRAKWIVGMHHHLVEYPKPTRSLSIRIGTALINGSWVVRQIEQHGERLVVMHGHRHVDWIGRCGALRIISAPSPVMGGLDSAPACFYIHTVQDGGATLELLEPERVDLPGSEAAPAVQGTADTSRKTAKITM